jgi:hypothetical protein
MGGQACILHGAAEFTRDIDLAVASVPANLKRLRAALAELKAEQIYFPALSAAALSKGHACHFRCLAAGLHHLRIDVMSKMRGVDSFSKLWGRRVELKLPGVGRIAVLSLPDLVRAKKTQRDKDWPMIRRLIEADITRALDAPELARVSFWLRECRTYGLLRDLARRFSATAVRVARQRPALRAVIHGNARRTAMLLRNEEDRERERDRRYWAPLRTELERWRLARHQEEDCTGSPGGQATRTRGRIGPCAFSS